MGVAPRGRAEAPREAFSIGDFYLEKYPDVRAAGLNPLRHYVEHGAAEGRKPHRFFDPDYYLRQRPEARAAGVDPLVDFLEGGRALPIRIRSSIAARRRIRATVNGGLRCGRSIRGARCRTSRIHRSSIFSMSNRLDSGGAAAAGFLRGSSAAVLPCLDSTAFRAAQVSSRYRSACVRAMASQSYRRSTLHGRRRRGARTLRFGQQILNCTARIPRRSPRRMKVLAGRRSSPLTPARVLTIALPIAMASRILMFVPADARNGAITTAARA